MIASNKDFLINSCCTVVYNVYITFKKNNNNNKIVKCIPNLL